MIPTFILVWVASGFIITEVSGSTPCYKCPNGVADPADCHSLTYCSSSEACMAKTQPVASLHNYASDCMRLSICQVLVHQEMEACTKDPSLCSGQDDGTICNTCCVNDYCNKESCHEIKAKLFAAYQAGQLDMATLHASVWPTSSPPGVSQAVSTTRAPITTQGSIGALTCVHCYTGVQTAADCHRVQTCEPGYSCYTLKLLDGTFRMGCKLTLACDDAYTLSHYDCFQCCSNSKLCNADLCGASSPTAVGKK